MAPTLSPTEELAQHLRRGCQVVSHASPNLVGSAEGNQSIAVSTDGPPPREGGGPDEASRRFRGGLHDVPPGRISIGTQRAPLGRVTRSILARRHHVERPAVCPHACSLTDSNSERIHSSAACTFTLRGEKDVSGTTSTARKRVAEGYRATSPDHRRGGRPTLRRPRNPQTSSSRRHFAAIYIHVRLSPTAGRTGAFGFPPHSGHGRTGCHT